MVNLPPPPPPRTPERRLDMAAELQGVKQGLGEVADAVTDAFPEKRVRQIVRDAQRRTLLVLWVAVLVTVGTLIQRQAESNTLSEAKVVSDYVRDCIQHPERLSPDKRVEECGAQEGTSKAVGALIEFQKCALLILPQNRTDENMSACVERAAATLRGD